jgi:hypothetical protein
MTVGNCVNSKRLPANAVTSFENTSHSTGRANVVQGADFTFWDPRDANAPAMEDQQV